MNEAKCSAEVSRPEFVAILDEFRHELAKLDENSGIIMDKALMLKDFREPNEEVSEKQPEREGVIGELNDCIRRMAYYNQKLNEVKNGLIKFIG